MREVRRIANGTAGVGGIAEDALDGDGPYQPPIRGVVGRLDWGYFSAGAINGYTVRRCADGSWTLHGTLVNFDAFKIRQRPLIFVAPHQNGEWRWPVTTIDVGEGYGPREIHATLGAQLPEMVTSWGRVLTG